MNNKQSLYNKYRPSNFDEVIGQNVAKDILTNSISKNKINHAYLFFGIRGTGKTTLARIFAKAVNCNNKQNNNPCNSCEVCQSINNGSAFDIIEIDAASNNGVDEIRTIKENTSYLTKLTKYKVYIIDEVHMLTKAAFNALLKTLEEPPKNTIFLLATTEIQKIPQTVLSRSIIINLEVMSEEDIKKGLRVVLEGENIAYDNDALNYITMVAGGSLRDAISALETTLLYNNELSVDNVISSLGLIKKDDIENMLLNDVGSLINQIDNSDKDSRKIALLILEVLFEFIKSGNIKYTKTLNSIISSINTIKDPFLLKISLKSNLFSLINMKEKNTIKEENVSRETFKEKSVVENFQDPKPSLEETPKIKEKKALNEQKLNVENSPKPELKIITDYADVNNYLYITKRNDKELLEKIKRRWKYIERYVTSIEYKRIVPTLLNTEPLAATQKTIIVGFKNDLLINEFKRISLTSDFFKFMKEVFGDYKFILPVNPESWGKILVVNDNIELKKIHTDLSINFNDFVQTEEDIKRSKINNLFGEENVTHE